MSLATSLSRLLVSAPDQPALQLGPETYTWADLGRQVAGALDYLDDLDLSPEQVLASNTEDPFHRVVWMLAASWAGYSWFLSSASNAKETQNLVVVEDDYGPSDRVLPVPAIWPEQKPHWLLLSSGTTGAAKLLPLTSSQIEANAWGAKQRLALTTSDRWLCVLPLGHIAGASIIARACYVGFTVILEPRFVPGEFHRRVTEAEVTVTSLVPTMLGRIVSHSPEPPQTLRVVMLGGAAFPNHLKESAAHWPIWLTWGMSETASQVATSPLAEALEEGLEPIKGHRVEVEANGQLRIIGPTAPGGSWLSADQGEVNETGRVRVLGRSDDVVKVGGNRVNLARVRRVFARAKPELQFELFTISDEVYGRQLGVALIEPEDGEVDDLSGVASTLDVWERPHWVLPLKTFPLTPRFKIDRDRLAELCLEARQERLSNKERLVLLPTPSLNTTDSESDSFVYTDSEGRVTL